VLYYQHVAFLLKIRSHLAKSETLHATKINGNKCAFGFLEKNHIKIPPKSPSQAELTVHLILYYP
jgi:hypothetical protein